MLLAFLIAVAAAVIALLVACEAGAVLRRGADPAPEAAQAVRSVADEQAARR